MTIAAAVLFLRVPAVPIGQRVAYESWYDESHIPKRMDKPGFLGAQRYEVIAGRQQYFVFYELNSPTALATAEYLELRKWEAAQPADTFEGPGSSRPGFERGIYDQVSGPLWPATQLSAPFVYIAGFSLGESRQVAFEEWLDLEHIPSALLVDGVVAARRFVATRSALGPESGLRTERPRCLVIFYLSNPETVAGRRFDELQSQANFRAGFLETDPPLLGRLAFTTMS